jgi:hypothetical protein
MANMYMDSKMPRGRMADEMSSYIMPFRKGACGKMASFGHNSPAGGISRDPSALQIDRFVDKPASGSRRGFFPYRHVDGGARLFSLKRRTKLLC